VGAPSAPPAREVAHPALQDQRARANWCAQFPDIGSLLAALIQWAPYAYSRYDAQFFFAAVGLMSGFFVAWCCIAIALWIHARRVAIR
jgi:hypothetical protein